MTVAVVALFSSLLSTSYAWYQFDNAVTTFDGVQTYSDDIDLAVVFTSDNNINTRVGVPLTSDQVDAYSEKTTFAMTPSSSVLSGRTVAYQIYIDNLKIDPVLASVSSLKYSLLETVNGSTTTVASGNFKDAINGEFIIKPMATITNYDVTYSYEFRLWLEEDNTNQNALMGKSLSGKIKVAVAVK